MTIIRALLVRVLFAAHGVIAIWRLFMVIRRSWCWYLTGALGLLLLETIITLCKNKGKEWKWYVHEVTSLCVRSSVYSYVYVLVASLMRFSRPKYLSYALQLFALIETCSIFNVFNMCFSTFVIPALSFFLY